MTEQTTVPALVRLIGLTMTAEQVDTNPNMIDGGDRMDHWRCKMRHGSGDQRRTLTVYFSMGMGHNGKAPDVASVLDCLASDSAGVENARYFEEWAGEYGYSTDSRKAEKTYNQCRSQAAKLRRFLGEDMYQTILWKCERM